MLPEIHYLLKMTSTFKNEFALTTVMFTNISECILVQMYEMLYEGVRNPEVSGSSAGWDHVL